MKLNRSGMGVLLGAVTVGVSSLAVPASAQAEPEADRLVYSRDWSLHTVRGDGTDDRVLAAKSDGEAHYFDPDLSSDGERVAATRCTSTSYADGCVIVDIAIDGSDLRVLDLPAAAGMPQDVVWSPDGTQLAFVSRPETDGASRPDHVMVVDRDGGRLRDLGEGSEVEWSPTGSLLIASIDEAAPRPQPSLGWPLMSMRLVHLDGRPSQTLRTVEAVVSDMVWSPDGRQIAVTLNLPHSVGIAQPDFAYIMNADGSGIRPIYRQDDVQGGQRLLSVGTSEIAWTPSSDAIVVAGEVFDLAGHRRGKVAEAADAVSWGQPAGSSKACPSGYWLVAADGGIFTFGDARFHGSTGAMKLNQPIVGMAPTPTGSGYWLVAADGGIFTFGDARFHGSTGAMKLNQPIVGMAPTPTGSGYWLVAADGGIFTFGDARFYGSTGAIRLDRPVVGMAVTPTGDGYWLVAADGGIFTFGDARFRGSSGGHARPHPIVAMQADDSGRGYWLVGEDGSVESFGDAGMLGDARTIEPGPGTGAAITSASGALLLAAADGQVVPLGSTDFCGSMWGTPLARPMVGSATTP